MNKKTDREWERFGNDDPYFGVIADEKYRAPNLTEASKEDFFRSGTEYIEYVLATVRRHITPEFTIHKALDFGCGVGRLVIPLAGHAQEVTGVDISEAMLEEARRNCAARSIGNVVFIKSDDNLSRLNQQYDFIHSTIALQHIPVRRGEQIFERLLDHLADEGIGAIHFTYAKPCADTLPKKINALALNHIPFYKNIMNTIKGRRFFYPSMQMHTYNLNRILSIIQAARIPSFHTEFTNHGGFLGITLYFRKPRSE